MSQRTRNALLVALPLIAFAVLAQDRSGRARETTTDTNSYAEFSFTRAIFDVTMQPLPGPGNSAWRDWPESDRHLIRGARRLTSVDIEDDSRAIRLTDAQLFDRPWLYAVEVGTWVLSDEEAALLREYLLRGGFLVVDDFHGSYQWGRFAQTMSKVFPNRPIVDVGPDEAIMNLQFSVDQSQPIPGILALGAGRTFEHDGVTPTWRGVYDDEGRLMVIINFNVDLGDAWEMADNPAYPEQYTANAYRYGVNYILYAMTH